MPRTARAFLNSPAHMAWKHVLGILLVLILAIFLIQNESRGDLENYSDANKAKADALVTAACDRANLQRAYELANDSDGHARTKLALALEPIVWCQQSVRLNETVLVPIWLQEDYIEKVVTERCWPELSNDAPARIVGCRALPSAEQQGF